MFSVMYDNGHLHLNFGIIHDFHLMETDILVAVVVIFTSYIINVIA